MFYVLYLLSTSYIFNIIKRTNFLMQKMYYSYHEISVLSKY